MHIFKAFISLFKLLTVVLVGIYWWEIVHVQNNKCKWLYYFTVWYFNNIGCIKLATDEEELNERSDSLDQIRTMSPQCHLLLAMHWSLSTVFIIFKVGLIIPVIATSCACFQDQCETKYMKHLQIYIRDFSLMSGLNGHHSGISEGVYSNHRRTSASEYVREQGALTS